MAKLSLLTLLALAVVSLSTLPAYSSFLPEVNSVQDSKWGVAPFADKDLDVKDALEDVQDAVFEDQDNAADVDDTADKTDDAELNEIIDKNEDEAEETGDEMTGFPLNDLDNKTMEELMDIEDDIFVGQTQVHLAKKLYLEADSLYTTGGLRRRKRIVPLVGRLTFAAARAIFRGFTRGKVTRSGSRITQQYHRPGNYQDAVRDFNSLRPDNVRSFNNGRISGQTGTMGNHRVTVRNGSSGNSRPTLEIRSHGGDMVRKFRYE